MIREYFKNEQKQMNTKKHNIESFNENYQRRGTPCPKGTNGARGDPKSGKGFMTKYLGKQL